MISYNPGYQSALKDLKHSTRQRFISIEFDYPPRELEGEIIAHEAGVRPGDRHDLAKLGEKVRTQAPRVPGSRRLGPHRRHRGPAEHRGSRTPIFE